MDCYFWELAFLFVAALYLGAELTRALLWRIFWWRHGRNGFQMRRSYRSRQRMERTSERLEEEQQQQGMALVSLHGIGPSDAAARLAEPNVPEMEEGMLRTD